MCSIWDYFVCKILCCGFMKFYAILPGIKRIQPNNPVL